MMTTICGNLYVRITLIKRRILNDVIYLISGDRIKDIVKHSLNNILYHNSWQIKQIYLKMLSVDLGDISLLSKSVVIRHDIVHRNGKD